MKRALPIWLLCLVALAGGGRAQPLDLTRARIPGGGGVSAGGQFTLFSTVAQPESAARVAGGAFTLDSGFLGATLPSPIPTVYFPSGTVTVPEDTGAQTRLTYATFEPGDAGPPVQPATFQLANNNAALFSVAPAIATDRTLTFTPVANASGTATVTVVVRADGVDVATNTFAIVVTPVNDQPSVTLAGNQTVLEDAGAQTVSSFATFTAGPLDESAQTPTHTLTADNTALFSAQPAIAANGTLTYTPAANANGSATITVVTSDGGGSDNGGVDRTTNTFTITVTAVNDAPSVAYAANPVAVLEDAGAQTITGFATFTAGPADESAQTPAYTLTTDNAALFSVAPAIAANGTLTFTTAPHANGSATVTVVVQDSGGTTGGGVDRGTNTFIIAVTPVNDAPGVAFAQATVTVLEDAGAQGIASFATFTAGPANESAQALVGYTLTVDNAALFSVAPALANNGALTFTPVTNASGSATVTVVVQDNGGTAGGGSDRSTNTFTIAVTLVNDAPAVTFAQTTVTALEDSGAQTLVGFATFSPGPADEAAQTLVGYAVTVDNAALFSTAPALANSGALTFTPATHANGSATVTVVVQDSGGTAGGGSDRSTNTFTIAVTAVNDAPSVAYATNSLVVPKNAGPLSFTDFAAFTAGPSDESAQTPTYTLTTDNALLFATAPTLNAAGTLAFTATPGGGGAATVTVVVQDSGGTANGGRDRATNTFTLTVLPFTANLDGYTVAEDTTLTVAASGGVLANDVGLAMRAVLVSPPTQGALTLNLDGSFTYLPATNFVGADSFTYLATNSTDTSAVTTVSLTVTPVNDAPVVSFTQGTVTVLEDAGAQTLNAFATFSSGPANESAQALVGYTVSNSGNALFSAQPAIDDAGRLTFTPATNANGSATVTVIAQDSGGTTSGGADKTTNTFTITVTPVNDAPDFAFATNYHTRTVAWGSNVNGTTNVPAGLNAVLGVAAGGEHILAVRRDGTVAAWGLNDAGQTSIPAGLAGVTAVAAGERHSLALRSDGTVVGWGLNADAQTSVPAGLNGVTAISAGGKHSLALRSDGTVVAWGQNLFGEAIVPAGLGDVTAIAAGYHHSVALKADGTVVVWGYGGNGERDVPAGLANVTAIAAGYYHVLALKSDGTVVAWGYNTVGQATVPAGLSGVRAVTAGFGHSIALKNDGTVVAWGINNFGQTSVPAGLSGVTKVVAGGVHAVALASAVSASVNVLEDNGFFSAANFVTSITPGPANESSQAVSFALTSDNPALFSTQPAVAVDGTLTFTPAANVNGTATVTIVAQDDGGTANGGVDKRTNTFSIVVTPVNDAPVVTFAQAAVTLLEDAGAQTLNAFATFSSGPANESAQALVGYTVTVDNAALFSAVPVIANNGALTFTAATNANGSATVTVVVQDNGGTAGGGVDKSTNTFTIVVAAVNDTPVANNDNYTMNQGDVLTVAAAGVLANDADVENNPLTATKLTNPTHGSITFNANGGFTYTPDTSFYGVDSFTYRASDASSNSTPATVSISVLARPVVTPPPGKQRVFSSAALRFSATNAPDLNAIRVGDPDSTALTLTLTVTNGTLAVTVTNGLMFPNGSSNTNTLVLAGPVTDLNAALESLAYVSVTNYFGDDALVLVAQDEGGRTNRGNGVFDIQVEIPARGAALEVPLNGYNNPGLGRMVTNATAVTLDTNLVQGITYDPTNNVVRVQPVGGQDGSTNRSSVTVLARYSDGTTELITVPVIVYNPLLTTTTNNNAYDATFTAPLFNLQTSLYEQKVRVQNNTPFDFTALRITATNLPATVTLQNATLTNGGLPYIEYNLAVAAGSNVTLKLEYFSSDLRSFTPGLKLELLNQQRSATEPTNTTMAAVAPRRGFAPDGQAKNYLKFPTELNRIYYVQYQDVAGPVWKTSPVVLRGTGFILNWMDDGPPNTETPPGPVRFYRVVTER